MNYYDVAAVGVEIERLYRESDDPATTLEMLGRSIGAALSRADGRRRNLETSPDFMVAAAPPGMSETEIRSVLEQTADYRAWFQAAVMGRVGPAGSASGPVDDGAFITELRALAVAS